MSDLVGNLEDLFSHVAAKFVIGAAVVSDCTGCLSLLQHVNVSVLIKFSQKTSVFTLIIISSP